MKIHTLLLQTSKRNGNLGEILDKPLILTRQPKKTSAIRWRLGDLPLHNYLNLGQIDQNPVMIDEVLQELDLSQPKHLLGEIGIQHLFPQHSKSLLQVLLMLFLDLRVYHHIINENND